MTLKEVKKALIDVGKTQIELAKEIQTRYREKLDSKELSAILGGKQQGAKARRVLIECENILEDWESKKGSKNE